MLCLSGVSTDVLRLFCRFLPENQIDNGDGTFLVLPKVSVTRVVAIGPMGTIWLMYSWVDHC
jgi:hypothetical protein